MAKQDLERLGHAIKDAEARLKVFSQTLETIEKELSDLEQVAKALSENIGVLKGKHIIALATEFKKAKDDTARVRSRTFKVRIDQENVLKASKEIEEYLLKAKEEYANTLKGPNNVLAFKTRKKNAKD